MPPASSAFRHPFLRELPPDHELLGQFEFEHLSRGQLLYKPGDLMEKLYFPEEGLISVLRRYDARTMVQAWCHGSGGRSFVGTYGIFLPVHQCRSEYRVIVSGMARVVARETMKSYLTPGSFLESRTNKIVQIMNSAIEQMLLCHSAHRIEERIATQLLLLRCAFGADRIPVTRAGLARMINCLRETTYKTEAQIDGVEFIPRSATQIHDVAALKAQACGCFDFIMGERDTLLKAAI